jgi:hypothetical protein
MSAAWQQPLHQMPWLSHRRFPTMARICVRQRSLLLLLLLLLQLQTDTINIAACILGRLAQCAGTSPVLQYRYLSNITSAVQLRSAH